MRILFAVSVLIVLTIGCKNKISSQKADTTFKNVEVAGAKKMITENKDLVILDVRTPEETDLGIIPNAIIIDYKNSNFDAEIAKLDKSKPYLVYCRSGGRSVGASNKMIAAGIKDVTNMKGGYNAWSE